MFVEDKVGILESSVKAAFRIPNAAAQIKLLWLGQMLISFIAKLY
jgi:hypothetical protein